MENVTFDGLEAQAWIKESIAQAKNSIKIAVYIFTDKEIANSLEDAIARGVDVKLLLSRLDINDNMVAHFQDKCTVHVDGRKEQRGEMHLKFCIIDDSLVLSGTYNYTINAKNNNDEELRKTNDSVLIKKYIMEFDKLVGNMPAEKGKDAPTIPVPNPVDNFSRLLRNHISVAYLDFDPAYQKQAAKQLAEKNRGSLPTFRILLDTILANVRGEIVGDPVKKSNLLTQINNSFESTKFDLEDEFDDQIKFTKQINQEQINLINNNIDKINEDLNQKGGKKIEIEGLISKLTNEISNLKNANLQIDREIVVQPLHTLANWLKIGLLLILVFYLSLFFASAIWKIFYEEGYIVSLLDQGISPKKPLIFDIDSLAKIFRLKGLLAALVSAFFFLIPLLLSNLGLINSNLKWVKLYEVIFGLFFIDIVVSFLVSQYTFRINMLLGQEENKWTIFVALSSLEFWMIFIFGALPLFISKTLIENLSMAYHNSNPNLVNRERNMERNQNLESIRLKDLAINTANTEINKLNSEIGELKDRINKENVRINEINNNAKEDLEHREHRLLDTIRTITNVKENYISFLNVGAPILIRDIVDGPVSSACIGYYEYINGQYDPIVAAEKINELENAKNHWLVEKFPMSEDFRLIP